MDLASLRAQQIELASSVCREDLLDKDPPAFIGGADVGFEQGGEVTRAAMVLLKYPSLELVEYKVARIATTMPYITEAFSLFVNILRCWRRGNSSRKSPICCLWTVTVFRIRVGLASPVILDCWWTCQPSVWRKNGCAVNLNHFPPNLAHLAP